MSSFQIYIMLQDIYKAYYKLLELQYLDDTPKTYGSERVASIFTLAVNASECVNNMSNIVQSRKTPQVLHIIIQNDIP